MKKIAIIGCGKVGTTLACHITRLGYPLAGLSSKSISSAENAADICKQGIIYEKPWDATQDADIVFITTPDRIIQKTCDSITQNNGFKNGSIVLHCSGSLPSTILSSAKAHGAITGSAHPLQSFSSISVTENPFKGSILSVEGEEEAVKFSLKLADELEAKGYRIKTDAKTLYHASAVVASNCFVTLVDFAYKLLGAAGIPEDNAYDVLGPLIEGTLSNIKKSGPVKALTGPVVRGDTETVQTHMNAIREKKPELENIYKILSEHTIKVAMEQRPFDQKTILDLQKALK